MKQGLLGLVFVGLGLLTSACAMANDSTARIGVGGLELTKTDHIRMVSEVLEISTEKIRVTYHFLNTSDEAITTTVAFPMPAFGDTRFAGDEVHEGPVESFKASADGKPIHPRVYGVFRIDDVDVTDKLRKIGLSDKQIFDADFSCFIGFDLVIPPGKKTCALTQKQEGEIRKLGPVDLGHRTIQETAYWEQTFPAGKEVEVVHEYKPFVGGRMADGGYLDLGKNRAKDAEACLDDTTRKAISGRLARDDVRSFYVYDVEYILGTARNWKGPIKNFRLILRKDTPGELVSLCFPGAPVKTSPTTIEFSQKDFVPQDRLIVYFYDIRE
ncbi:MAG TPA: DUF4424 family protein [Gallionella sp.]|nr:DUF4424 family protein [Gallionella sp.]